MSQHDCIQLLKEKDDWMTTKDITEQLGISPGNVCENLNRLLKKGAVIRRRVKDKRIMYEYKGVDF